MTCKACGAQIVWAKTEKGKLIPLDFDIVPYKPVKGGKERIFTMDGKIVAAEYADGQKDAQQGRVPHWATCPKADQFRKKKP